MELSLSPRAFFWSINSTIVRSLKQGAGVLAAILRSVPGTHFGGCAAHFDHAFG